MRPLGFFLALPIPVPRPRSHLRVTFLVAMCLLIGTSRWAEASPVRTLLEQAHAKGLSQHPQWLSLLHLKSGSRADVIISPEFYLSPTGQTNPEAELEATLRALESPWTGDPNAHPRCKYPARYLWLARFLKLPNYKPRDPRCESLESWAVLDELHSISLYLIGGYFGNPASTFGHAVLKFNSGSTDQPNPLFDVTVGFGALVPENEWSVRYVAKGIFGGYDARFLDKYYYSQDLVYSRSEFRDIWDYQLNLSQEDQQLLVFHVWEILGKNFDYFFLDKNCAYRLAELMELVIDAPLARNHSAWYAPVELFFRIEDANHASIEHEKAPLVDEVQFIPSTQRVLIHQLRGLTPKQRALYDQIVEAGPESIQPTLQSVPPSEQIVILEALLAHADYQMTVAGDDHEPLQKRFRDQVLLARLRLPSGAAPLAPIPDLPAPTDGSRPAQIKVGAGWDNESAFARLSWSPFSWEIVGQNSLEGDELVVSDLALGVFQEDDSFFVDRYDLIRIINFNTTPETSANSGPLSWELRIGSERVRDDDKDRYDAIIALGFGRATQLTRSVILYGMVDGALHSVESYARLRPHLGVRFDGGAAKVWLYGGAQSEGYITGWNEVWGGKGQYQTSERTALYAEISNEQATRYTTGLSWFF
jgi:hypothetical protein